MKTIKKYPIVSFTIFIGTVFSMLYILTYFFTASSYALLWDVPADRSRFQSSIYYGALFSVLPYAVLGAGARRVIGLCLRTFFFHAWVLSVLIDKVLLVQLAFVFSPHDGYNLLCEEFPFYCQPYIKTYTLVSIFLSGIALWMGLRVKFVGNRS